MIRCRALTGPGPPPNARGMTINLDALTLRELDALVAAAERRKALLARRRPPADVRRALIAYAEAQGYSIGELLGAKPGAPALAKSRRRRKRGKVPAKYRDPENRRNTWSGRGRMPIWLATRVKRGQDAADFLIPGLARPTAKAGRAIGRKTVFKPDISAD